LAISAVKNIAGGGRNRTLGGSA